MKAGRGVRPALVYLSVAHAERLLSSKVEKTRIANMARG